MCVSSIKALSAFYNFRRQICFCSKCFQALQSVVKPVLSLVLNANTDRREKKKLTNKFHGLKLAVSKHLLFFFFFNLKVILIIKEGSFFLIELLHTPQNYQIFYVLVNLCFEIHW